MKNRLGLILLSGVFLFQITAEAALIPSGVEVKKQKLGHHLPEGEKAIYLRFLDSYRKGQIVEAYRFKDLLLKNYPQSIHADNAVYLTGMLDMQRGRFAEAIKNFGAVQTLYPAGNKVPAALYAKSMTYNKLNMNQLSLQILEEVIKKYPGSPESQRAWMDLRLKGKTKASHQ